MTNVGVLFRIREPGTLVKNKIEKERLYIELIIYIPTGT